MNLQFLPKSSILTSEVQFDLQNQANTEVSAAQVDLAQQIDEDRTLSSTNLNDKDSSKQDSIGELVETRMNKTQMDLPFHELSSVGAGLGSEQDSTILSHQTTCAMSSRLEMNLLKEQ